MKEELASIIADNIKDKVQVACRLQPYPFIMKFFEKMLKKVFTN